MIELRWVKRFVDISNNTGRWDRTLQYRYWPEGTGPNWPRDGTEPTWQDVPEIRALEVDETGKSFERALRR